MIAGEEAHYRIRIDLHDSNESNDDSDRGSPVHGLRNDERIFGVRKFLGIVSFMGVRDHEYLPIARKQRIKTNAGLTQEALRTDNRAELFRAIVSRDPHGQVSQASPIAASQ